MHRANLLIAALVAACASAQVTVKAEFDLIIDPNFGPATDAQVTAAMKSALASCFSVQKKCDTGGYCASPTTCQSGDTCSDGSDRATNDACGADIETNVQIIDLSRPARYVAGLCTTDVTDPPPDCTWIQAYMSWYGCESNYHCEDMILNSKDEIKLDVRHVEVSITSEGIDLAHAKSVGQNSNMMTEGLLSLMPNSGLGGKMLNYKVTEVSADDGYTVSSGCELASASALCSGDECEEQNLSENVATNDWRHGSDDDELSQAAIFGIVVGTLLAVAAVAAIAVTAVRQKKEGAGLSRHDSMSAPPLPPKATNAA